ncbi:MAG: InlB B-repeat-containing protein [Lachnospiraceae bacterium]|nr:InlB B-repeat-containing protein [Lachnospiraceae bacterium]
MKQKTGRKLLSFLLTLAMVVGMMPGMSLTAYADENVAKVGETEYATLSDALNAWNDGTTLTLLANVETDNTISMSSGTKAFNLDGHNITKTGDSGSVFQVTGGSLTVNGTGSISGGKGISSGGWEIRGGGFYVINNAEVAVNNITITGNEAYYGGGVFVGGTATFTMNNGTISSNHINNYNGWTSGGGVWIEGSGTFIMNGGSVTNNTSDSQIAGIHVYDNGSFKVSGNAIVTNNTRGGSQINVSGTITVDGALTEGANIGVNHAPGVFTNSTNTDYNDASKFTSDNTSYVVGKKSGGQLLLGTPVTVTFNANGKGTAPDVQTVASGSLVTEPTAPTADGYTFGGWYKEEACTNAWNFNSDTVSAATTLYAKWTQKESISRAVTFKVVNGSWNDETTADKTVTLTGYEGDTLKLAAEQIPAVGTKPNDTYKAGSWDVLPSTETAITTATTYTYTYVAKEASVVTKAPEAKTLTYNGQTQELVTAGTATGGEMQYALGNETGATQPYTTSIPAKTDAGTYYVWYKVVGDENYTDTEPKVLKVTIDVDQGETKIETEVKTDEKSPKLETSDLTQEVAESTLTDKEKAIIDEAVNDGKDVNVDVYLAIRDYADEITAEDKAKLEAEASDAGQLAYFDISLFKEIKVDGSSLGATAISELQKPLKLTMGVPKSFPTVETGYTRTYTVLRLHEGKVTTLPATVNADGTISFETDRFSVYALVYKDTKDATTAEASKTSPKTGDSMPIAVLVVLMLAAAGMLVFMDLKKKKN